MTDSSANRPLQARSLTTWRISLKGRAAAFVLASITLVCVAVLETRFFGLEIEEARIADTPVTLYRATGSALAHPVIVAHGFAGSRQMMDQISVSLARQGFFVASIDLPGHGRSRVPMSTDVTRLEGTTAQLVKVVESVAAALAERPDILGPVSFVGHSMASDIVIRASQSLDDVGGVVAVSMYSPAVTETHPQNLLVLSGAFEGRLRDAGLEATRQIAPDAVEGETVAVDGITRRTAIAPFVGHVGVLYSTTSLDEITMWLQSVTGLEGTAPLDRSGWISGVLFIALVLLVKPLSKVIPKRRALTKPRVSRRAFLLCLLAPFPVALAVAALPIFGVAGFAAFGSLAVILGTSGLIQLAILRHAGVRPEAPDAMGAFVYLAVASLFAFALDRYGAAFLPVSDRSTIALALVIGALPLMIADTLLVQYAPFLRRFMARLAILVALAGAMAMAPTELGLTFTTIPVLVLYFLVYGSMARWIAMRRGTGGVAVGKAVILAWAIAASTPLFAVSGLS